MRSQLASVAYLLVYALFSEGLGRVGTKQIWPLLMAAACFESKCSVNPFPHGKGKHVHMKLAHHFLHYFNISSAATREKQQYQSDAGP